MPGKTKPTQDLSGHVTMTTSQQGMFNEVNRKAQLIEFQRNAGLLVQRPYRNPVKAEKTPRKEWEANFDFSIPEKPKEVERWILPDTDWGLMSKLNSQKKVFDHLKDLDRQYSEELGKFKEKVSKRNNGEISARNSVREELPLPQQSARNSARGDITGRTISTLGNETNRSVGDISARDSSRSTKDALKEYNDNDLYKYKVTQIKANMSTENPELLDKWRAKRAANFLNRQKHPEYPPTSRDLTARPFKGGGSTEYGVSEKYENKNKKASNSKKSSSHHHNPGQMTESLDTLMEELKKTDAEIERQQLKISLKSKTKGYEK